MIDQFGSRRNLEMRLLGKYPNGYRGEPLTPQERSACVKFFGDVSRTFDEIGIRYRTSYNKKNVLRLRDNTHEEMPDVVEEVTESKLPEKNFIYEEEGRGNGKYKGSLKTYLGEIGNIKLLDPKEERELGRRVKEGDTDALKKLAKANSKFVVKVAKLHQGRGLCLEDLIGEGNCGLMEAAIRFDEKRGFKLISYAVWWIRQKITQALADYSEAMRVPINIYGLRGKLLRVREQLQQELSGIPTLEKIAEVLNLDASELNSIDAAMRGTKYPLYIDRPVKSKGGSEDDRTYGEVIEAQNVPKPDSDLMEESKKRDIKKAIETLSKREAKIIRYLFGLDIERPLTLEETGEKLNITRERVRQIKERALRRLRHKSRSKHLRQYLG